eukprot:TRINITY_DN7886_c0_g1_i1.p1 TRINITY_DN7886_c0_g1~~TRINITY_DN7886_c0_g1_i1.p1  ORF type:complete len:324 (-),score=87.14 TRINITY_DN7886_c0_g1_i1:82-1053(-)
MGMPRNFLELGPDITKVVFTILSNELENELEEINRRHKEKPTEWITDEYGTQWESWANLIEPGAEMEAYSLEFHRSSVRNIRLVCKEWKSMLDSAFAFRYLDLKVSIEKECLESVKFLSSVIDPILLTECEAIPLSVQVGNWSIFQYLLSNDKFDPNVSDSKAIHSASYSQSVDMAKALFNDPRVDPSGGDTRNPFFQNVITWGDEHLDFFKSLLSDPRFDPSEDQNEAIMLAVEYGKMAIFKLLLSDERVNPADQNNRALQRAIEDNNEQIVELLREDVRVIICEEDNLVDTFDSTYLDDFLSGGDLIESESSFPSNEPFFA